ncbi:MAG: DUF3857 domain-containing protein [Chitinophagaceae bacterium]|nr:MAG: DUF3857 domain-containing protein [Chitinophagaceae bacterium]
MNFRHLATMALCLVVTSLAAQDKGKTRFGKISKADFEPTVYSVDSNAAAVVLADIGSSEFKGNSTGWFSLEFKYLRRARILSRKGYDIAEIEIPVYEQEGLEEKVEQLKASTYNLEDGKVVETRLDLKDGLFKTRINKNLVIKKFTFPNIREGAIIEYEYKLVSDFLFNLQAWTFQGDYPVLWSEYRVGMPQFFYYISLYLGYQPFEVKTEKNKIVNFSVSDNSTQWQGRTSTFSAGVTEFTWAMKDIPAIKEENFTSTLANHRARIEFQLAERRAPLEQSNVMGTWPDAVKKLMEYEDFGLQLTKDNSFLNEVLTDLNAYTGTDLEKSKKIFAWVRDNITSQGYGSIYTSKPLRQVLKSRTGTAADINLLLVAMLRKAGLLADPVLLSTKSHGWAYASYPLIARFNYVIAQVNDNGKIIYLDASQPKMGYNRLPENLYNGHARTISERADSVTLDAELLKEEKLTSLYLVSKGNGEFSGAGERRPGYLASLDLRNRIAANGTNGYEDEIAKGIGPEVRLDEMVIDSLRQYDMPVVVKYKFDLELGTEDIIYVNPMFGEGYRENPFKSATRVYPVETPYKIDELYLLRMDIPQGYEVDELPKPLRVQFNAEGDGSFEYLLAVDNGALSVRSRLKFKRCYFYPEEYNSLREFFNLVVKKHTEQVVFRKKK